MSDQLRHYREADLRLCFRNYENRFSHNEAHIFQLQKDADELRKFLRLAERQKVKDFLTIELRKVETEIILKQEKGKGENPQEQSEQIVKPVTVTKTATSHTPTAEIRTYGIVVMLTRPCYLDPLVPDF